MCWKIFKQNTCPTHPGMSVYWLRQHTVSVVMTSLQSGVMWALSYSSSVWNSIPTLGVLHDWSWSSSAFLIECFSRSPLVPDGSVPSKEPDQPRSSLEQNVGGEDREAPSYTDLLFRIKLVFSFTVYSISSSAATKEIYVCFLLMLSWFNFYIEIFDLPAIHFDVKEKGMDPQLIVFLNG